MGNPIDRIKAKYLESFKIHSELIAVHLDTEMSMLDRVIAISSLKLKLELLLADIDIIVMLNGIKFDEFDEMLCELFDVAS